MSINIEWHERDLRPIGCDDPMFYHYSNANTHQLICTISDGTNAISVYCDGEMRVIHKPSGNIIKDSDALVEAGIDNDEALIQAWFDYETFEVIHNTWFDLYEQGVTIGGEHLDSVCDSLTMAIDTCTELLNAWKETTNDTANV